MRMNNLVGFALPADMEAGSKNRMSLNNNSPGFPESRTVQFLQEVTF